MCNKSDMAKSIVKPGADPRCSQTTFSGFTVESMQLDEVLVLFGIIFESRKAEWCTGYCSSTSV